MLSSPASLVQLRRVFRPQFHIPSFECLLVSLTILANLSRGFDVLRESRCLTKSGTDLRLARWVRGVKRGKLRWTWGAFRPVSSPKIWPNKTSALGFSCPPTRDKNFLVADWPNWWLLSTNQGGQAVIFYATPMRVCLCRLCMGRDKECGAIEAPRRSSLTLPARLPDFQYLAVAIV